MSGEVMMTRRGKWAEVTLRQNIRRAIRVDPAGGNGPGQYFERVRAEFDTWMDQAMPRVDAYLDTVAQEFGLVLLDADHRGARRREASSEKSRDKIELVYWSTNASQPEPVRRDLADAVQRVVDEVRPD